jgi:hypothetical protein
MTVAVKSCVRGGLQSMSIVILCVMHASTGTTYDEGVGNSEKNKFEREILW